MNRMLLGPTAKTLLGNFTYLSILEIIGILFPLLTYPYLIRIIGAEKYGVIVFVQAIVSYVVIIINFGFNVSATKSVSENRDNSEKLSEIYSSITYLKLLIFITLLFFAIPILYIIQFKFFTILIFFLGLCLQEIFFPTWFFQGVEKMKFITIISFISKLLFLLFTFIIIRKEDDYIYIPLLYSIGGIVTAIASFLILYNSFAIRFKKVKNSRLFCDIKDSTPFFASRLSSVIMERTNVLIIGAFFSYDMVSVYDICIKVISILKTPFMLIAQVLYPNVAKTKNSDVIKRLLKPVLIFGVILAILISLLSNIIISLLGGEQLQGATQILRIMVWYIPIVSMSYFLGASTLVVFGHAKEYNLSVVYSVIFYLFLILSLIMTKSINLYTIAISFLLPELFVASYRAYNTYKYKILMMSKS